MTWDSKKYPLKVKPASVAGIALFYTEIVPRSQTASKFQLCFFLFSFHFFCHHKSARLEQKYPVSHGTVWCLCLFYHEWKYMKLKSCWPPGKHWHINICFKSCHHLKISPKECSIVAITFLYHQQTSTKWELAGQAGCLIRASFAWSSYEYFYSPWMGC